MEMSFIQDVLEPILSGFEAIASEQGIDFQVIVDDDELPGVTVCPKSLQEAVVNIIDNAFKYVEIPKRESGLARNPSPRVRVRLSSNKKPLAPGVTIMVEDNGPGIPECDRNDIFQRGFRSRTTSFVEGSGIGLDISHTLISRMGGTLEVAEDDENHALDGARMKVVLFRNPNVPS
jgi:signal transduction histidine kinase